MVRSLVRPKGPVWESHLAFHPAALVLGELLAEEDLNCAPKLLLLSLLVSQREARRGDNFAAATIWRENEEKPGAHFPLVAGLLHGDNGRRPTTTVKGGRASSSSSSRVDGGVSSTLSGR